MPLQLIENQGVPLAIEAQLGKAAKRNRRRA
jgi:hypothetical protein